MNRKVLHIGIMPYQDYKKRSLAIARGEYRPRPNEPKIWFESVRSMAQVLSNENQVLLKTILDRKPESLKELEAATGRSSSNLSRTLKTMARYGIVRMEKVRRNIRPVVEATDFTVQFGLYASSHREHGAGAVRNELPRSKLRGIKTRITRVADYAISYTPFPVPASSRIP